MSGLSAETTPTREQRDALNDDLRNVRLTVSLSNVSRAVGTDTQRVGVPHQGHGHNHRRRR
jgi:hypothetical protein